MIDLFLTRAPFDDGFDHLRYHLARALHQHPVADAQVFALNIPLVVQGGARDRHAANVDRFQFRPGVDGPRAPDIDADAEQARRDLNGWVLEGDGPARVATDRSQFLLLREAIDLNNHAVDLVGQIEAFRLPLLDVLHNLVQVLRQHDMGVDDESPFLEQLQGLPLGLYLHPLHVTNLVGEEAERAGRGDTPVFLPQRTGSRVARVSEDALSLHFFIQLFKAFDGHVDFAAHLDFLRNMFSSQFMGNFANGAHVGRPVLADQPVAT